MEVIQYGYNYTIPIDLRMCCVVCLICVMREELVREVDINE